MPRTSASWAWQVAGRELASCMPRRWAHCQGAARQAELVAAAFGSDPDTLVAAAVLHDVGYAPPLVVTGFHPLDGARFLRDVHRADERLVRLVANHSFALLEAEERGLSGVLEAEFPVWKDQALVDALVYCDLTTAPDGSRTSSTARVAEILDRYGTDSLVGRFVHRAASEMHAAVARTEERLGDIVNGHPLP